MRKEKIKSIEKLLAMGQPNSGLVFQDEGDTERYLGADGNEVQLQPNTNYLCIVRPKSSKPE